MQEALATIGEKLCVELSHCLSQHGFTSFSAESKSALKGQITAIIQSDNIVRKLMGTEALLVSCLYLLIYADCFAVTKDPSFCPTQTLGFRATYWLP